MTSKSHRILIVDNHTLMREGLDALISAEPGFEVVGSVADGKEAMSAASELGPDIILMDLNMPRTNGLDAIVYVKKEHPEIKIVALTFHKENDYVHAALSAGADAYILKDDNRTNLFLALNSVLDGNNYLSPAICDLVVAGYLASTEPPKSSWEVLTPREREVLKLIAEGSRTKDIATYLSLSPKTVEKHRTNLMRKLDLRNVSAVTVYAVQNGLV